MRCVNALSGRISFLHEYSLFCTLTIIWCQCPKRADFISTNVNVNEPISSSVVCQCPKRADFISTLAHHSWQYRSRYRMCQCPKRADFISTGKTTDRELAIKCVNALSGRISFLQYPLETRINTGFPDPFLQVFVRIFWFQLFFNDFWCCSQFVHIWIIWNLSSPQLLYSNFSAKESSFYAIFHPIITAFGRKRWPPAPKYSSLNIL